MSVTEKVIGVDIGGSSIKAAVVDTLAGRILSERAVIDTPPDFDFGSVADVVDQLRRRLGGELSLGVGIPAATRGGLVLTAPTAHEVPGWVGQDFSAKLRALCDCPVVVSNDADAAGLAEVRFGAARDQPGMILVLTLGTGIGSALFAQGRLVPNIELGKIRIPGRDETAEQFVAARVKREQDLSWDDWADRLAIYLSELNRIVSPDLVVLGGAVSEQGARFLPQVRARADLRCEVRAAELGNDAGLIGAACASTSRYD